MLPNELILDRVWSDAEGEVSYLWEYVRQPPAKSSAMIPVAPRYIESERGVGYRFMRAPAGKDLPSKGVKPVSAGPRSTGR